ncbi:MAG TPA: DUF1573 domain-containing protein [Phycisphaerae bacterium]|nr:DUF1573 domain-containing protein [Phycisphaerae bacterium]HNU45174.1 DUF1573 domain-containing protein [Phycisphaerae bacterium]
MLRIMRWIAKARLLAVAMGVTWVGVGVGLAQLPPTPPPEQPVEQAPKLVVAERIVELGLIYAGDKKTATWVLRNEGTADLVIEKTQASCGCTLVQLTDEQKTLPSGRTLELKAEFDTTGRRGTERKTVTVYSNDPQEPKLVLTFNAEVKALYEVNPRSALMVQQVRRGQAVTQALDVFPPEAGYTVQVAKITFESAVPLAYRIEPAPQGQLPGQRVRFQVADDAPLGNVSGVAVLHLTVTGPSDGAGEPAGAPRTWERQHKVMLRGEIVGDLIVNPVVINPYAARQRLLRGQSLEPVRIASTDKSPFDILGVEAGPLLETTVEMAQNRLPRVEYLVTPRIRQDAKPGPFGTLMTVRTSSIDQPLIQVPVFGIIMPLVDVEPQLVLLRQDGTPAGTQRRVKLLADPREALEVASATCANAAVQVEQEPLTPESQPHLRYLNVRLVGKVAAGRHEATLVVQTNIKDAERLEVPVTIVVPE